MEISEKTLRSDVEALCAPGHRVVGSSQHRQAQDWLRERIRGLGIGSYKGRLEHSYETPEGLVTNLMTWIPGTDSSLKPLLVGAHYDTCGEQPGADDNAAAVAITLALAKPLAELGLRRPVILAFFDAEEPPFFLSESMGSQRFYEEEPDAVALALIMDLVGHAVPSPGFEELLVITGMESHRSLPELVWAERDAPGLKVLGSNTRYVGDLSDYAAMREGGKPFLFLSCGRWKHYHRSSDTPDRLDYPKMAAIAALILRMLKALDSADLRLSPSLPEHSLPREVDFLRHALGPFAAMLPSKPDRSTLDRAVQLIQRSLQL